MKRRSTLRQAFVVTAGAVTIGGGCVSVPFDDAACPQAQPAADSACADVGMKCPYRDECGSAYSATCGSQGWTIEWSNVSCNPPPPQCPARPTPGTPCLELGMSCHHDNQDPIDACDQQGFWVTCTESGWSRQSIDCDQTPVCCDPPVCPVVLPIDGEICEPQSGTSGEYPFGCSYEVPTDCGPQYASADCVPDIATQQMVWAVVMPTCPMP